MEMEIIFAGFGGQGVLTAGLITAYAANAAGRQVLWMPAYGGQMRGGKSYSLVKISDTPICHPDIDSLDVLVAMNLPSLESFSKYVKKDGLILINKDTVPDSYRVQKSHISIIRAPFAELSCSVNNPKGANIAALGLLLRETGLFLYNEFENHLLHFFTDKGKTAYSQLNCSALKAGYEYQAERDYQ